MKEHLMQLLRYEKWANKRILDAIKELPETDESCLDLMSHIMLVQRVWYSRITNQPPPPVWDKRPLAELYTMYEENNEILDVFMNTLTETNLYRVVEYKNTKGDKYENTIKDILTHMFNHSTYHRGQIVERLKGKIPKMPTLDFIYFLRT